MSFTLPDLIIENSIRNGLRTIRQAALQADALTNPTSTISQIIDVLFDFSQNGITGPGGVNDGGLGTLASKYSAEKTRLITFFRDTEVAVVQSFSDVQTHLPCVSIQLQADGEDQGLALTDDFGGLEVATVTNPVGRDENTIHANATINVGIHTKEQLLTKYLYHVVKYTVLSNKLELIRQNFIIATFRGSDFNRDAGWQGDHVYTRFLNISGKTEDSWVDINEIAINLENISIDTYVGQNTVPSQRPSSLLTQSIPLGVTSIPVGNSFYFPTGPTTGDATLVTIGPSGNNPTAILSQELVEITSKNNNTNTITVAVDTTIAHPVISATTTMAATRSILIQGNVILNLNPTTPAEITANLVIERMLAQAGLVQTRPSPITTSNNKQNIFDADGVLHRSDSLDITIEYTPMNPSPID